MRVFSLLRPGRRCPSQQTQTVWIRALVQTCYQSLPSQQRAKEMRPQVLVTPVRLPSLLVSSRRMRTMPPLLAAPTVEPHSLVVYSKIKHALFFLLLFSEINEMLNNIFIKHIFRVDWIFLKSYSVKNSINVDCRQPSEISGVSWHYLLDLLMIGLSCVWSERIIKLTVKCYFYCCLFSVVLCLTQW